MRIAIMQPYFLPYAGYFRLFQEADLFVIYDCVQFIRRGWIHRNRLMNHQNQLDWLTLPLQKASRDIRIQDLTFAPDAPSRLQEQLAKFPLFQSKAYLQGNFATLLEAFSTSPVSYMVTLLKQVCTQLQLPFNIAYSSELHLPTHIKGQDRIIAIAKHFQADTYINPPGGVELYDTESFKQHGLTLKFLPVYQGAYESILARLHNEEPAQIRAEITAQGIAS